MLFAVRLTVVLGLVRGREDLLERPPPDPAPLPLTMLLATVRVPSFIIPLPINTPPFLMVTPEMATMPPVTLKTRLALLPLMARLTAPGPAIDNSLLITSSPLVRTMVPVTLKSIVSPGAAEAIACRSEPGPLSSRLVTVRVAA